ncbi:hypothetical protein HBB16_08800 [Pseudonocardia sp. MCCB 268]|nr:hypothetical protein [Pseudonocardia cytotoxica]
MNRWFASTAPPGRCRRVDWCSASTAPAELATTAPATDVPAGALELSPAVQARSSFACPDGRCRWWRGCPARASRLPCWPRSPRAGGHRPRLRHRPRRRPPALAGTPYPAYRWLTHWRTAPASSGVSRPSRRSSSTCRRPRHGPGGAVRALARLTGRAPHLLWLDAPRSTGRQHARGRVIRSRTFAVHAGRLRDHRTARAGDEPGWTSVRTTDRSGARRGLVLAK